MRDSSAHANNCRERQVFCVAVVDVVVGVFAVVVVGVVVVCTSTRRVCTLTHRRILAVVVARQAHSLILGRHNMSPSRRVSCTI